MVLETNCIRQPARHLVQIISLTIMGTPAKSLQLHINLKILMSVDPLQMFVQKLRSVDNLGLVGYQIFEQEMALTSDG